MGRNLVAETEAQQAAWKRLRSRISEIREDMLEQQFMRGLGQDAMDECLMFLFEQRRYDAAREYLDLLVELDRANFVLQNPVPEAVEDVPDYLRSED